MAEFSPDGRWLAYCSNESGQMEVYVRPFPSGDGKWQISNGLGREPRWSPDGSELFYRSTRTPVLEYRQSGGIYRVSIDTSQGLRAGIPELFTERSSGAPYGPLYSVAPDGERLLVLGPSIDATQLLRFQVRLNWAEELRGVLAH